MKKFKITNNALLIISWILLFTGLVISVYFIISTGIDGYFIWGKEKINFTITGQFGDFFGGVIGTFFALTGTLFIILTFRLQSKQYEREAFESKFYEMLRLHSDNVKEIKVQDKQGREAVEFLVEQLDLYFAMVESVFDYLKSSQSLKEINVDIDTLIKTQDYVKSNDEDSILLLMHKLSYGYFFYGINKYRLTENKSDILYSINEVISFIIETKLQNENEGYRINAETRYNAVLGHYYRHLYQIIKLVANSNILVEKEKYNFVKIVRSQLSDYEQILLYYNALSVMGKNWIKPLGETEVEKMCFIARFRMIKNIPYYFNYFGMKPLSLFKVEKNVWNKLGKDFFEADLK